MIGDKPQNGLDKIDEVINCLGNLISKIYYKLNHSSLDEETVAFLVDLIEQLENTRIELKDLDIEIVRKFIKLSKREMLQLIFERDRLLEEERKITQENAHFVTNTSPSK